MKVLVTGGAGFIGSHLVDSLLEKKYGVTVLDNLKTGRRKNIQEHIKNKEIRFIEGDIKNKEILFDSMKNVDIVFHLAADLQGGGGIKDPLADFETNTIGTFNVLLAAKKYNTKVIFSSSVMVYGGRKSMSELPIKEDSYKNLITPYATSKFTSENYCLLFNRLYDLKVVVLRYFNVYGPRVRGDNPYMGVTNKFILRSFRNEPMIIYNTGDQTRDFVEVRDLVNATVLASEKEKAVGEIINVGSGVATSVNKLADIIYSIFSKKGYGIPKPVHGNPPEGETRNEYIHAQADLTKAKKILGYEPKITIERGIEDLISYYEKNRDEL